MPITKSKTGVKTRKKQNIHKTAPINNAITPLETSKLTRYDANSATQELNEMIQYLQSNEHIMSKAQLFEMSKFTSSRLYKYKLKYQSVKRIQESLKKIEEIIEARLVNRGLNGKAIPMTIFLLKNYYNYQDKREIEQETTHIFKVTRGNQEITRGNQETRKVIDVQ